MRRVGLSFGTAHQKAHTSFWSKWKTCTKCSRGNDQIPEKSRGNLSPWNQNEFKKTACQIKRLLRTVIRMSAVVSLYLDIISWLESNIEGRSIPEIIQEKALARNENSKIWRSQFRFEIFVAHKSSITYWNVIKKGGGIDRWNLSNPLSCKEGATFYSITDR